MQDSFAGCCVIPKPIVCSNPLNFDPTVKLTEHNPGFFPSFVFSSSQSKDIAKDTDVDLGNLDELFTNEDSHDDVVEEPVPNSNSTSESTPQWIWVMFL